MMRPTLVIAAGLFFCAIGFSDTLNVPGDYGTIQAAIDAAVSGDVVLVGPGTYMESIDFLGKAIVVQSSAGAADTVIDGKNNDATVWFRRGEDPPSRLEGFTITNGFLAGVHCEFSSPTITKNIITKNIEFGINCYQASPVITRNTVFHNIKDGISCDTFSSAIISKNELFSNRSGVRCDYSDSAILKNKIFSNKDEGIHCYSSSPDISGNIISENDGGGVYCGQSCHGCISNNMIVENHGMGIFCVHSSDPVIRSNLISRNHDDGIYCWISSAPDIIQNRITDNLGCGLFIRSSSSPNIVDTLVANNHEEGLYLWIECSPTLTGCTISRNKETGIYCREQCSPFITNSIIWYNQKDLKVQGGGDPSLSYCCIPSGYPGPGNTGAMPFFADPVNGDFHLRWNSPCRDAGNNKYVTEPTDFEGDPRIVNGTVDMGADEFHPHLYYLGKATPGSGIDIGIVDFPSVDVNLFVGDGFLGRPVHTMYGEWFLIPPLAAYDLGPMPGTGVLKKCFRIPPGCPTPLSIPMQGFNKSTLTNLCVIEITAP